MASNSQIRVLFFAALREQTGRTEQLVELPEGATIEDVWRLAVPDQPLPARVLVARNQAYSKLSQPVSGGDEIAFFPPVTGG